MNPSIAVLYGELVLSLYPLLLKSVHTPIFTQILSRFAVFPVLATLFAEQPFMKTIADMFSVSSILPNIINIAHVAVSYLAFKALPISTAISLFYLYPLFNVIAGHFLFGESLSLLAVILIGVCCVGVYFIATSKKEEPPSSTSTHTNSGTSEAFTSTHTYGVVLALLAALTETMIFVFVRADKNAKASPFYAVNHLYPLGLILLVMYGLYNTSVVDISMSNWAKLIGFNALLGFTGYVARFYSIPKIPVLLFSLLSFFGVAFGYLWGNLFTLDVPTNKALLGSGLIAGSIAILRYFA
jgi:drug/metabolite transporter (DMT)-like permease